MKTEKAEEGTIKVKMNGKIKNLGPGSFLEAEEMTANFGCGPLTHSLHYSTGSNDRQGAELDDVSGGQD